MFDIKAYNFFPECKQIKPDANYIDISKCCINKCNKTYNFCLNLCDKKFPGDIPCKNQCIILHKNLCYDYCQLPSTALQIDNDFYKCTQKSGCNTESTFPDKNCVEKNKENIYECCVNNCDPTKVNCGDYVNFFMNLPYERTKLLPTKNNKLTSKTKLENKKSTHWLIYLVITFLIVVSFILILKVKKT